MNAFPVLAFLEYFASTLLVLTIVVHARIIYMEMGNPVMKPLKTFLLKERIPLEKLKVFNSHPLTRFSASQAIFLVLQISLRDLFLEKWPVAALHLPPQ